MATQSWAYASESGILPQHGFHLNTKLQSLLAHNPYLFRVYTPKERFPLFDKADPYFLAPKYSDKYVRSPVEIRNRFINECNVDYTDVAKHMDWTTRVTSPFISTSLSFAWCIWDGVRRFHQGVKKDVEVAIIDGRAIADRAATAIELLEHSSPAQRTKDYWKWHRFSDESQSVLVHGSIPGTAVLASIPLLSILRHLPSYFLKPGFNAIDVKNPLTGLGWDYTEKKLTYRRFCRDMSNRFHCLSTEARLTDSTVGSLALSLAFLRLWFHQTVDVNFDLTVRTLSNFAFIIAQWPGHWWAHEHPEIHNLIYAMAVTLCQELRKENKRQDKEEVSRLQGVVNELCEVVKEYEVKFNSVDRPSNPNPPARVSARIQISLTPPDTPKSSSFLTSISTTIDRITEAQDGIIDSSLNLAVESQGTPSRGVPNPPLSAIATSSINTLAIHLVQPSRTTLVDLSSATNLTTPSVGSIAPTIPFQDNVVGPGHQSGNMLSSSSLITDDDSWTMISQVSDLDSDGFDYTQASQDSLYRKEPQKRILKTEVVSGGSPTIVIAPLPTTTDSCSEERPEYLPPRPISGIFSEFLEPDYTQVSFIHQMTFQRRGMLETAAHLATGFLIGAFMTAAVFNSQRRMIVHLT